MTGRQYTRRDLRIILAVLERVAGGGNRRRHRHIGGKEDRRRAQPVDSLDLHAMPGRHQLAEAFGAAVTLWQPLVLKRGCPAR